MLEELALELPAGPRAAADARRALADRLRGALEPDVLADLRLVVSELVTNSVKYGPGGPVRVKLQVRSPRRVAGEVVDHGDPSRPPSPRPEPGADGGYGLALVGRLATRWGVREGSTHVWFELG